MEENPEVKMPAVERPPEEMDTALPVPDSTEEPAMANGEAD